MKTLKFKKPTDYDVSGSAMFPSTLPDSNIRPFKNTEDSNEKGVSRNTTKKKKIKKLSTKQLSQDNLIFDTSQMSKESSRKNMKRVVRKKQTSDMSMLFTKSINASAKATSPRD